MLTASDKHALLLFVAECELGRTKKERLWWMVGTTSGGDYIARVQLNGVTHAAEGGSIADAVNALGQKLLSHGLLTTKDKISVG